MKFFLYIVLAIFTLTNLSSNALAEAASNDPDDVTFVMTNIFVHDNSYTSSQEAVKLTGLLQLTLMGKTSCDWVSRDKIKKIIKELKISTMGFAQSSSSLKIGKLTKADISLKGDIYRQKDHSWLLIIEFIDLEHADIISQVEMQLLGKETAPFSFTSNDSLKATNIIAKALNQNAEKLNKQKDIIRIAPLFFQNKEPGGRLS